MGCIDLREWIALLEKEGELHRITARVDWDCEIGTISRRVLEKHGPALLFENVKDHAKTRGRKVFGGGIGTRARLASTVHPVVVRACALSHACVHCSTWSTCRS